jgi:OmcA/MtrC family decaheme c-type cytochrome
MKIFKHKHVYMVLALLFILPLLFAGCKGSDGSNGANGANGTPGADGTNGANGADSTVAGPQGDQGLQGDKGDTGDQGPPGKDAPVTDESCMVCHTTGQIEDIAVLHPDPTNDDLVVTITNVDNVGGNAKVSFHVDAKNHTTAALSSYTTLTYSNISSFKMADLIPASTGTNTWSTAYWEMNISETPATLDVTGAASGNYAYTFVLPFGGATTGYNNADYATGNTKRIAIEFGSKTPTGYNRAVGIADISGDPGTGNPATIIPSVRQFVTIQACRKCHGPVMDGAAHANNRNDIRECDFCHSALYGSAPKHLAGFMAEDNADLPVFIHGIHGSTWTDTNYDPGNEEFLPGPEVTNPVTYPQELKNCTVCHSDPSGSAPGDLTGLNNWKTHPTGRVCHSCHTSNIITNATTTIAATFTHDNTLTTVDPVPAGPKNDSQCSGCHSGLGTPGDHTDIVTVHDTTPVGNDVPEYNVTISAPTYSNGLYYVSGETFTVDVTLAVNSAFTGTTTPVPAAYTLPSNAAYISGSGLHVASLYIYGPRSFAKPLTGTQANSLFGKGDATGFHYKVTVPAGMTPGTYLIRARIADYSYDRNNPTGGGAHVYQTESYALTLFQIGTSTVQKKVDGNGCVNCHGDTLMHENDHAAPFDTDHCTSCHDQSGGHAAYIGNRVHAIHSASITGDMVDNRDWSQLVYELGRPVNELQTGPTVTSPVTFPLGDISPATSTSQSAYKCVICHTSETSGTYRTNAYETPCLGCHGDVPGATDHMMQMGGKYQ